MSFENPVWLTVAVAVLVALPIAFVLAEARRNAALGRFASPELLAGLLAGHSPRKRVLKYALIVLAAAALALALAQPRWGHRWEEVKGKGIDVLIALDVSKSMLAEDFKPNRLERAKLAVLDLVESSRGDRIGLIAFAGQAFLQCPLTLDRDALRQTLDSIEPGVIPVGGSNLARALREAAASLSDENNYKFVILITDGEDLAADGIDEAGRAAEKGITIYTVGVGSPEGEVIPITQNGSVDYLRDSEGNIVTSKLDEATLDAIAGATGGFYVPLGATGEGLRYVYEDSLGKIPGEERAARPVRVPIERFQWPLGLSVLLLAMEIVVGTRKKLRPHTAAALVALTLGLFAPGGAELSATPLDAQRLFKDGRFEEAALLYELALEVEPQNAEILYNHGASLYRSGRHEDAAAAFNKALPVAEPELQADIFYNLGNAHYRIGEALVPQVDKAAEDDQESPMPTEDVPPEQVPMNIDDTVEATAAVHEKTKETLIYGKLLVDADPVERQPVWEECEALLETLGKQKPVAAKLSGALEGILEQWAKSRQYYASSLSLHEAEDAADNLEFIAEKVAMINNAQQVTAGFLDEFDALKKELEDLIEALKRPTAYVLDVQRKADELIHAARFPEAYELLQEAAEKDPTSYIFEDKLQRMQKFFQKMQEGGDS